MSAVQGTPSSQAGRQAFAPTRWSVVLAATEPTDSRAAQALAELCRSYWYPLYAFVRRSGHSAHDAQDLTQAFFAELLEKNCLSAADPHRGRFRTFLLAAFKHFLSNEWDRAHAQKRGGGRTLVPIAAPDAETRYGVEPLDDQSPEKLFDRQWALAVLNQAVGALREEYAESGKAALFEALKNALSGDAESSCAQIAEKLKISPGAVKVAFHRLRRRYRLLLRRQIAQTVASPGEVDDEIRDLLNCL